MTTIWIDAHLSPAIATWLTETFGVTALALHDLGLRDAEDPEIFEATKAQGVIFMTKDSDFVDMADVPRVAVDRLYDRYPDAQSWVIRIGYRAVFRIGSQSSIEAIR